MNNMQEITIHCICSGGEVQGNGRGNTVFIDTEYDELLYDGDVIM